jgi:hypothetical protein
MEESVVCEIPSNAIDKIHRFRQRGFAYISQALKCEETETDIDLVSVVQTFSSSSSPTTRKKALL